MGLISRTQAVFILVFTIVEVITLEYWLQYRQMWFASGHIVFGVLAILILFIGLLIKHYIATVSGNNSPKAER